MKQDSKDFNFDYSTLYGNAESQQPKQAAAPDSDDLQKNLEAQLRAMGQTVTDSFQYGFDGLGVELGGQAMELGGTISEMVAKKINHKLNRAKERMEKRGMGSFRFNSVDEATDSFFNLFSGKEKPSETTRELQRAARKHLIRGIVCVSIFAPIALAFGISFIPAIAEQSMALFSLFAVFFIIGMWGSLISVEDFRAYRFFTGLQKVAQGQAALPIDYLADSMRMPEKKIRKRLNKYLDRGWLSAWMDKKGEMLYFDLDAWRTAREQKMHKQENTEPTPKEDESVQEPVKTKLGESQAQLQNFIDALEQEQGMMAGQPQAQQELKQLQETTRTILDWITKHPESLPKIRHMTEQYIPTTLKLLYVYNDLKMHNSDNAANVRKDIAGMLHSLNLGIAALQDKLLDDVAINVTGDIAALQGMLARDGLSEDEISQFKL